MSPGYYIMEKKTREEFDDQGWFHTGDIAIWTSEGFVSQGSHQCLDDSTFTYNYSTTSPGPCSSPQIKIVDRLKNLIKLKGGEYIAIESMESTYANSVFVNGSNGGIMCYGNGDMDRPVALVQVSFCPSLEVILVFSAKVHELPASFPSRARPACAR